MSLDVIFCCWVQVEPLRVKMYAAPASKNGAMVAEGAPRMTLSPESATEVASWSP